MQKKPARSDHCSPRSDDIGVKSFLNDSKNFEASSVDICKTDQAETSINSATNIEEFTEFFSSTNSKRKLTFSTKDTIYRAQRMAKQPKATGSSPSPPTVTAAKIIKPASSLLKQKELASKAGRSTTANKPVTTSTAATSASGPAATESIQEDDASMEESGHDHNYDLNTATPEWVLDFQRRFREQEEFNKAQESRLINLESLVMENAALKKELAEAKAIIAELKRANGPTVPASVPRAQKSAASTPTQDRDLSTNGSTWAAQARAVADKPVTGKKMKPSAAVRAFQDPNDGPQGFEYVYIGRSRKITRSETRTRLRSLGVETKRVLDITFPASGIIGILVHVQYVDSLTQIMTEAGAEIKKDFNPIDPKHIADPRYASYSEDGLAQVALELNSTRCINALLFLHKKKPHMVKNVGRSFVDECWISDEDLQTVLATPVQQVNTDSKNKNKSGRSAAASVFIDRSTAATATETEKAPEEDPMSDTEEESVFPPVTNANASAAPS